MDVLLQLNETIVAIKKWYAHTPQFGIVLGSGLGNLGKEIEVECEIPYGEIPHFKVSAVEGHSGKLIFGKLSGKRVVCMAGRYHYYEGYDTAEVIYPIRVMKMLGIETLFLSNAAGGMNPTFKVGDIMMINDHVSFFAPNPLIGKNIAALGPRFPDMSEPYSKAIIAKAKAIAVANNIDVKEGVYYVVTGPTFETRAEYKMLHILGADVVGMSTVQEVIAARHMSLPVFAMSVVTDMGIREEENTITHQEVLEAAHAAEPKLTTIFKGLIAAL